MEIKLVKYWKIELFEQSKDKSVISNMMNEPKRPFFTGYSKEPIKPNKLQGGDFISLAPSPDSIETKSVRTYRVDEINCTPIYEQPVDAFADAAEPLIKWLNENANPHSQVVVTSTGAELLVGERVYNTEKFLKD
ncbi:hypothetical protein D3T74_21840 [Salmonella enterica subsp. enterica]|uniref:Uncharacterized protein n=2 Tax=Salmonella enterica I TaxID=59201 RepID=A0A631CC64_SALET|nr:hypothetical protein [Salmonella enterica]EAN0673040.1 hypothetical protein [Salmonella enterica subsp. enterica]EAQ8389612.1 hypothetical protein [Salmonella enterica subsp. enterica serovar Lubbock]EAR0684053.1 hypothetical protein [Salmonella enterica subsp. enterica serovar Lille]EAT1658083.1 hypothetical protein [Salmonella enterica subsp. enterica serovar Meleagridis]EBQ5839406.1 hypothetical protein [Salmonella enterica subsp. enterica serovar Brandenburg]EBY1136253.1 hypothetical p